MKRLLRNGYSISDVLESDADAYVEHLQEQQIHDQTLSLPHPYTRADAEAWIARVTAETVRHGQSLNWAIRCDDGGLIGGIGILDWKTEAPAKAQIGYWLAKPYWGQGIVTDAVEQVTTYCFDTLKVFRVEADVFAFNLGSARVLEKAGYAFEGVLPARYIKNGQPVDARRYARAKPR